MRCVNLAEVREIRWTEGSEDHVWRHGVTPAEVEEVVNTRPRYVRVSGDVTYLFGQTNAGRALIAVTHRRHRHD